MRTVAFYEVKKGRLCRKFTLTIREILFADYKVIAVTKIEV